MSVENQKVLVVGDGARESAMVWKLAKSPSVGKIFIAPGNAGTAKLATNLEDVGPEDIDSLINFAEDNDIDFTVVGPDKPLALGIVDTFNEAERKIYGPTQEASQIEWSKIWASEFMHRHNIPHPQTIIPKDLEDAESKILGLSHLWTNGVVVKADGLTDGKGVVVCDDTLSATNAVHEMMMDRKYGPGGKKIILQERLIGQEVSVMAIVDGNDYQLLPLAQDYKRLRKGDQGPNTGGMGSFAPAHFINKRLLEEIQRGVIEPFISGIKSEGRPFKGTLYSGLMIVDNEPVVIEFNARFGDPETQVQLPLIDVDFLSLLTATSAGHTHRVPIIEKKGAAVCVVLAAPGYPENPQKGLIVHNLEKVSRKEEVLIFHAGTRVDGRKVVNTGGRVLNIVGLGKTVDEARKNAYENVGEENEAPYLYHMEVRRDIGV